MRTEKETAQPIRLLLTPEEAALALGISRAKLYPMLMCGSIPSIRIGGSRRVSISALERFIEQQVAGGKQYGNDAGMVMARTTR